MRIVKIFGERNTGSNYLQRLLEVNFDVKLLDNVVSKNTPLWQLEFVKDLYFSFTKHHNLGWKHGIPDGKTIQNYKRSNDLLVITISKNPYSFLLSLFKNPYHRKGTSYTDLEGFLKSPWRSAGRENYDRNFFETPVDIWNVKNKAYVDLGKLGINVLNIRYEDLLSDPERVISLVSSKAGLTLKDKFRNIERSTKNSTKSYEDYKDYYLQEKWVEKLDRSHIDFINSRLDVGLVRFFGYNLLGDYKVQGSPETIKSL